MYNYVLFLLLPKESRLDSFPFFLILTFSFTPEISKTESTEVRTQPQSTWDDISILRLHSYFIHLFELLLAQ